MTWVSLDFFHFSFCCALHTIITATTAMIVWSAVPSASSSCIFLPITVMPCFCAILQCLSALFWHKPQTALSCLSGCLLDGTLTWLGARPCRPVSILLAWHVCVGECRKQMGSFMNYLLSLKLCVPRLALPPSLQPCSIFHLTQTAARSHSTSTIILPFLMSNAMNLVLGSRIFHWRASSMLEQYGVHQQQQSRTLG